MSNTSESKQFAPEILELQKRVQELLPFGLVELNFYMRKDGTREEFVGFMYQGKCLFTCRPDELEELRDMLDAYADIANHKGDDDHAEDHA